MKHILQTLFKIPKFKRRFALFVITVVIAQGVAMQALPLIDREVTQLVENISKGQPVSTESFLILFGVAVVVILIYQVFNRVSFMIATLLHYEVWYEVFKTGFEKVLYHDIEYLGKDRSGSLLNKITRASNRLSSLFTDSAAALFRNIAKATVSLSIMFVISWEVGLGVLITLVLYTIIYWIRFKKDIPYAEQRDTFEDDEFSKVWEVVPQVKVTKIFTNEQKEIDHIRWIGSKINEITKQREVLWNYANIAEYILVVFPTLCIKFYAAYLAIQGRFGIPTFVLLYVLISSVQEPLWVVNWFMWEMQDTLNRAKKYLKILDSKEKVLDPKQPQNIDNPYGDIKFHSITFDYKHGEKGVLDKINLTFKGKQTTALVGKSGAGKSTITNLICRFFDPTKGRVTLDGVDIKKFTKKDLRSHIGFVMQESFVFSGTIVDNMQYAKKDATKEEIIQALKKAKAWEFVKHFKKGVNTKVGERGIKLSGGQKQRLSIARTILKDPAILILDEATNALDSESEVLVQEALEEFMHNRTVIMIAHRLSTIQNADTIYVIDNGKVKEKGNHAELVEKNGIYKMLYDIQSGSFAKQKKIMEEFELV